MSRRNDGLHGNRYDKRDSKRSEGEGSHSYRDKQHQDGSRENKRTFFDGNTGKNERAPDAGERRQYQGNRNKERVSYYWPAVSKDLKKFTFFWRADSPFSQHHPARFTLDGLIFNCSEQYYMYMKAVVFKDEFIAQKIMRLDNPTRQKSVAKEIPNFDQEFWDNVSYEFVKKANIAKFGQNEKLLNLLVATRGTELVEASPGDRKWGIGMEADNTSALRKETWRGENKLGRILTEIRDTEFAGVEYEEERTAYDGYCGYIGFWRSSSPFSPQHLSPFSIGGKSYVSLFHYLMVECMEQFGNKMAADKIAKEMRQNIIQKEAYSHKINDQQWNSKVTEPLIKGNFHKFNDNPNLKALLSSTNGMVLVYQNSSDGFGSGVEESDNADLCSFNWKGNNNLGLILTFMRDEWIKNPDLTLDELIAKDIASRQPDYGVTDMRHMKGMKPSDLPNKLDVPPKKLKKVSSKDNQQRSEVSHDKTKLKDSNESESHSKKPKRSKSKEKVQSLKSISDKNKAADSNNPSRTQPDEASTAKTEMPPPASVADHVPASEVPGPAGACSENKSSVVSKEGAKAVHTTGNVQSPEPDSSGDEDDEDDEKGRKSKSNAEGEKGDKKKRTGKKQKRKKHKKKKPERMEH